MNNASNRRARLQSAGIKSLAAVLAVSMNRHALAANDTWTKPAGGNWETTGNWSTNALPAGADAYFNLGSGSPYTVTLPGQEKANNVYVQNDQVTFDTNNNTLESLEIQAGLFVTATSGQTTRLTLVGSGGYGIESDFASGFNVGAAGTGTANFTDNNVRLTSDGGNYNFGAGSIVNINAVIRGDSSAGLVVRGTAYIGTATLQAGVTVGGPGPLGATLNGSVGSMNGPVNIGSGGVGTVNALLNASQSINIGVDSLGTVNANGISDGADFIIVGTATVPGVLNVSNGGIANAIASMTIGVKGVVNATGGNLYTNVLTLSPGAMLNAGGAFAGSPGSPTAMIINNGTIQLLNTASNSNLSVGGSYNQSIAGLLDIALATETAPGSGMFYTGAELISQRPAILNGTLDITAPADFPIATGQSFQVLDLASETGAFNSINLPPLPTGLSWNTQNLYTNGTITAVPEPVSAGVLALSATLLRKRDRKRRVQPLR